MVDRFLLHHADGIFEGLVIEAVGDALGHHIAGFCLGQIRVVGDGTAHDVAIGDHPDQAVLGSYRKAADLVVSHPAGDFCQGQIRRAPFRVRSHGFFYEHCCLRICIGFGSFRQPVRISNLRTGKPNTANHPHGP